MTFEEINNWFDAFYAETVGGKKPVRGRAFSGGKIEIWGKNNIVIVLHDPYPRGATDEGRANDFVRTMFDSEHQQIFAEIDYPRFQRVVSGEEPLTDSDWTWPDED